MVEIKYVEYGVANVIGGVVYMHKALLEDKLLHDAVLEHELKHVSSPKNLSIDFDSMPPKGLTRWMFRNPSSFWQLSPVWYIDKRIIYSKFMFMFWFLIAILSAFGVMLILWSQSIL